MAEAGGRFAQAQGDQLRLGRDVEQFRGRRRRPFLANQRPSKPSRTNACRTFSTVRVRQPTASLILASSQAGPSASALSKIVARRSFSDLPFSFLMVASQIVRSSFVSRTIYFFDERQLYFPPGDAQISRLDLSQTSVNDN